MILRLAVLFAAAIVLIPAPPAGADDASVNSRFPVGGAFRDRKPASNGQDDGGNYGTPLLGQPVGQGFARTPKQPGNDGPFVQPASPRTSLGIKPPPDKGQASATTAATSAAQDKTAPGDPGAKPFHGPIDRSLFH